MNCEQAHELLWSALDRETYGGAMGELEAHLRDCTACRQLRERFALEDRELRTTFAPRRVAVRALAERVIAQLPTMEPRRKRTIPVWPMLLSAAAGFLLAVLVFKPWVNRVEQVRMEVPVGEIVEVTPPAKGPEIQLAVAKAPVQFRCPGDDEWRSFEAGCSAPIGTRVRTTPNLRCELNTPDGSIIRLNGSTEVVFTALRTLDLVQGQILARIAKAQELYRVQLPDMTVTALGTEFDVLAKPSEVWVSVLEGSTQLDAKAGTYTVATGEQARFLRGELTEKNPMDPLALVMTTRWVNEILVLKGTDNKELNKRIDDMLAQLGNLKGDFLGEEEIRALGDRCVLPLTRYLQSERSRGPNHSHKRQVTSRILADLAQPWSIPDLIQLLDSEDDEVRFQAARGLVRLTQQNQGLEPQEWRRRSRQALEPTRKRWHKWWEDNKQRYPGAP